MEAALRSDAISNDSSNTVHSYIFTHGRARTQSRRSASSAPRTHGVSVFAGPGVTFHILDPGLMSTDYYNKAVGLGRSRRWMRFKVVFLSGFFIIGSVCWSGSSILCADLILNHKYCYLQRMGETCKMHKISVLLVLFRSLLFPFNFSRNGCNTACHASVGE